MCNYVKRARRASRWCSAGDARQHLELAVHNSNRQYMRNACTCFHTNMCSAYGVFVSFFRSSCLGQNALGASSILQFDKLVDEGVPLIFTIFMHRSAQYWVQWCYMLYFTWRPEFSARNTSVLAVFGRFAAMTDSLPCRHSWTAWYMHAKTSTHCFSGMCIDFLSTHVADSCVKVLFSVVFDTSRD